MELRPPQRDCCRAVYRDLRDEVDSTLAVLATGVGKTILSAFLIDQWNREGLRCLFLAHREELINQATNKFFEARKIIAGIEKAELKASHQQMCVVGSVQSMQGDRLRRFSSGHFDYIITDEAHRSCADTYRKIYDHFKDAKRLGITATAYRQKGSLADVYQKISYEYNLRMAVADGLLCRIVAETIPLKIGLDGVSTKGGDYNETELAHKIEPYLEAVADELYSRAPDRKIIVFLPLRSTAKKFREILERRGYNSFYADGRDRTGVKSFEKSGAGSVLSNAVLCTEGYDHPQIDCVVVLRPTKSTGLYSQMVGRGTRLFVGKEDCIVYDFLWHSAKHDLCKPSCLIAENDEVAKAIDDLSASSGKPDDIMGLEEEAKTHIANERERKLADNLRAFVGNKSKKFDPVLESLSIYDDRIRNWQPIMEWERQKSTPMQARFLKDQGFDAHGWDRGYASAVIDDLTKRRQQGLSTPKQMRALLRNGVAEAQHMTIQQATEKMTELRKTWDKSARYKKLQKRRRHF